MLTTVQIILLVGIGIFGVLSIAFMIAFIVECAKAPKQETSEDATSEIKSVFEVNVNQTVVEEKSDVNEMLADLDKLTEGEVVEEAKEEVKEEPIEEPVEETKEEEVQETTVENETVEEPAQEEVKEEAPVEEVLTVENLVEDDDDEEVVAHEPITPGTLIDYETRLEKVKKSRAKIQKQLEKTEKAILKYDRTIRRKDRNQKMLDRRAGELTNLNLLMYSVTDIKNVDEEKKVKQEELTAHIAELKASIQDAEEYIESNRAKHEQEVSLQRYLSQEKARYTEEIKELEALIKSLTEGTDAQ